MSDLRTEIGKRYYKVLDSGKPDGMNDLLSPNLVDHDGHGGNPVEEIKGLTASLGTGFENGLHVIEELHLIEDDRIFIRWRMTGKHVGEFFGVPGSGAEVDFVGHDLIRVEDGLIAEIWHVEDLLGVMGQISGESGDH